LGVFGIFVSSLNYIFGKYIPETAIAPNSKSMAFKDLRTGLQVWSNDQCPRRRAVPEIETQRVGVIDVGSNSVRLVVFEGPVRAPSYFFNEKVLCGLGADLAQTRRLSPGGVVRALDAIGRFALIAERMKLDRLFGVATAAVREAEDGPDFVEAVKLRTGLHLKVATGEEEGRLSAQGVLMGMPAAEGLVVDIGGSSLEMASVSKGAVGHAVTTPLGPLALRPLSKSLLCETIAKHVDVLATAHPGKVKRLYLVGGSWRALAGIDMAQRGYPLPVLQGYSIPTDRLRELSRFVATAEVAALKDLVSTSSARLTLLKEVSGVLVALLDRFSPRSVMISAFGLREGALYERMDQVTRGTDPLLTACRAMEHGSARAPGFADALIRWIDPFVSHVAPEERRLVAAACYLHDVHWSAHPDVRRQFAFEAVCRANLAGIDHAGRVFIAAVLAQRYKTGNVAVSEGVLGLIPEDARQRAGQVGRAIRLGAMLTGGCGDALSDTRLSLSQDAITLHLGPNAKPLMGEVAEKRLARLARDLGRRPVVIHE
jgi:exopolyphosphatase/guanosine-5'-triphosphate,3'-diphosphate pyrophosphatase